jgi:hypothetical protein
MMLWWIVTLLALYLLFVYYRLMRRDLGSVLEHWHSLETILEDRLNYMKVFAESPEFPREFDEMITKEIRLLDGRKDERLSRLRQRIAIESRFSAALYKLLQASPFNRTFREKMEDQQMAIDTAVRYYDIATNRYHQHFESLPGKLVGILPLFEPAPKIEIQKAYFELKHGKHVQFEDIPRASTDAKSVTEKVDTEILPQTKQPLEQANSPGSTKKRRRINREKSA